MPQPIKLPDVTIVDVQPAYVFGVRVPDKVWVKIANLGNADAKNFMVYFQWKQGMANEVFYYFFVNLPAGQSVWKLADSKGYDLWMRGHHFRFTADFGNSLTEWNESNNVYNSP